MTRIGKISTIRSEYTNSNLQTMQSELAKKGMTRVPGTGVFKYPYKELSGVYRTGLDPDAAYIKRIKDDTAREAEIDRVTKLKDKLEKYLQMDLGPRSEFWNYTKAISATDSLHVQPVKLMDGDNYFDLTNPLKELEFAWLRVHPTIASSYEAWKRGEYPADTQFYVADDEVENVVMYKKKQLINKAIVKFDTMTPGKQVKIARQMGLPVQEDTKPEVVYNLVDNLLKQTEFKDGEHKGLDPVSIFHRFADMDDKVLDVKDLVKQSINHSILRKKADGKIYEGAYEIAKDEESLVKKLVDDDNQEDRIILEQKLKSKKLAAL